MTQTKTLRPRKQQWGQFLTPPPLARRLVADLVLTRDSRVLEPSFGDGAFLLPLIERFFPFYTGPAAERLQTILTRNIFGAEIDPALHARCLAALEARWGRLPPQHALACADFFRLDFPEPFDVVVGNPPFGGTIDPALQDLLDRQLGWRGGRKIKKETYAFFIVKSLDLLKPGGELRFICSDTFLTIRTMQGLRELLLDTGAPTVCRLADFSEETRYAMVTLDLTKLTQNGPAPGVHVDNRWISREQIALTGSGSWQITDEYAPLFSGPKLGDFFVASSGMTIGANALFVRPLQDGRLLEPSTFEFIQTPISLGSEQRRARLGVLPPRRRAEIAAQELGGETRRDVRVLPRSRPLEITLPHPDYRPYNKALSAIVYAPPTHAVYWKDEGDAVLTFKKNGPWYLHGVGGQKFFGREGLTWPLISPALNVRWLPPGFILDSGAPCAFPRPGVSPDELWFTLGWTLSDLCGRLLKDVINHTRNIQGKDFERLPYPFWVPARQKQAAVAQVQRLVRDAQAGRVWRREDREIAEVGALYEPL